MWYAAVLHIPAFAHKLTKYSYGHIYVLWPNLVFHRPFQTFFSWMVTKINFCIKWLINSSYLIVFKMKSEIRLEANGVKRCVESLKENRMVWHKDKWCTINPDACLLITKDCSWRFRIGFQCVITMRSESQKSIFDE